MSDEHALLVQLKQGYIEALGRLYPQYAPKFYRYARFKGLQHANAEDIAQNTFYRILDGIDTYDELRGAGAAWMWQICRNVVIDFFRAASRISEARLTASSGNPSPVPDDWERRRCARIASDSLSDAERDALDRGRGPGRGRAEWHEAAAHYRREFEKCYGAFKGDS